jgi:hypothetical protein
VPGRQVEVGTLLAVVDARDGADAPGKAPGEAPDEEEQ